MDVLISAEINALHTLHGRTATFLRGGVDATPPGRCKGFDCIDPLPSFSIRGAFKPFSPRICLLSADPWLAARTAAPPHQQMQPFIGWNWPLMSGVTCCYSSTHYGSHKLFSCTVLSMTEDLRANISPWFVWKCAQLSSPRTCTICVITKRWKVANSLPCGLFVNLKGLFKKVNFPNNTFEKQGSFCVKTLNNEINIGGF